MKTIEMTFEQGMSELEKPDIRKMLDAASRSRPNTSDPDAPDLMELVMAGTARRRNAKNNRHDESVTIDLPRDYAKNLRGPKWSKAIGDYIVRGIDSGDLSLAPA